MESTHLLSIFTILLVTVKATNKVSIVAVHGMGGHWKESWTAETGVFWLQDLLPKVLPQARVYSFAYDSRTRGDSPLTLTICDHGKELVADLTKKRQLTNVRNNHLNTLTFPVS